MDDLVRYKTMPVWNAETLPSAFQRMHNTQEGTWAQLKVLNGSLVFTFMTAEGLEIEPHTFTPSEPPPLIAPRQWHRIVSYSPDMECQLSFYCTPEAYAAKPLHLEP
jgi:tellurite methyltransferase